MMPNSIEIGKRFFGEKLYEKIIGYMKKDPENNLDRIVDLIEKAPVAAHHKEYTRMIRDHIKENPVTREYIGRLISELDENIHNHFFVNLLVNASLIGLPRQMSASKALGCSVP